jgi:hypothetical protein
MDKVSAEQYHKTLCELFTELQQATTPELRAPIIARMHNILFPLYVVDTSAAQHATEALHKLKHPEQVLVNAAHTTLAEAFARFEQRIREHPDEPFVVYGDEERLFARAVSKEELDSFRTHNRLLASDHAPFVSAVDSPAHVERVLRVADAATVRPVLERLGFPHTDAIAFFTTRAHPKLGKPAERVPSMTICTLRAGIPARLVRVRAFT